MREEGTEERNVQRILCYIGQGPLREILATAFQFRKSDCRLTPSRQTSQAFTRRRGPENRPRRIQEGVYGH
jgi:hypothetical protein